MNIHNAWLKRKEKTGRSLDKFQMNLFMNRETILHHDKVIRQAEDALKDFKVYESDEAYASSDDPLIMQGFELKKIVSAKFRNYFLNQSKIRILVHIPSAEHSPAHYSIFNSFVDSCNFLGADCQKLGWDDDISDCLLTFKPNVFITSDYQSYIERIDWTAVQQYRLNNELRIGLTAALEEYGNSPLDERMNWAYLNKVDFYFTFRDEGYVKNKRGYEKFFNNHYPMLYLPFGVSIEHYYPVAGIARDIDYAIIATRKSEHATYMKSITHRYLGFIDGPGWRHTGAFTFNRNRDRYIYARARVGLNVHQTEQIRDASEVNERTHQLAACGVPQLCDHPKIINKFYSSDEIWVADTPAEYKKMFQDILSNPSKSREMALKAQYRAFNEHTTYHRASSFIINLGKIYFTSDYQTI